MDTTYARRSDGKLIEAKQGINKSLSFFCPGCEHEVYAATEGKIQRPHFRHKSLNGQTGCSAPESYVHWITKELFAEQYQKLDAFYLSMEMQKNCAHDHQCIKEDMYQLNLKEKYPYIKVEKHHNGFRPDCLLYNDNGDKLYFEAHYTSEISEAKRDSGVPIIEVKIYNEENINDILKKGGFTTKKQQSFSNKQQYYSVEVYNKDVLLPKEAKIFDCKKNCVMKVTTLPQNIQLRNRVRYRLPNKNIPNQPDTPKHELPYGFINRNKSAPNKNQSAIEYLSRVTGRTDHYSVKTTMPHVLGKCMESYNKSFTKFKNKLLPESVLAVLVEESTFLFIHYNSFFYGAVRYEGKWHIFNMDAREDKTEIVFIESVNEQKNIEYTIKQFSDIF